MKYKNLKQLQAAYKSGELSKKYKLRLDNDNAMVCVGDKIVFRSDCPPGADLLEEALRMLGIPHEDV